MHFAEDLAPRPLSREREMEEEKTTVSLVFQLLKHA
jgi:hypothetical protein